MHSLLFFSLFLLFSTTSLADPIQQSAELSVDISAINSAAGGNLRVALFRGEQSWPKFKNALQTQTHPVSAAKLQIIFSALPYADDYAVEIHHDENANGKFDMRWFPYPRPKEGVGVSNNRFGFGHPDFSDARFSVEQAQSKIKIQMHY